MLAMWLRTVLSLMPRAAAIDRVECACPSSERMVRSAGERRSKGPPQAASPPASPAHPPPARLPPMAPRPAPPAQAPSLTSSAAGPPRKETGVPAARATPSDRRQTLLRRVENKLSSVPEVELLHHVVDVVGRRLGRDGAFAGELLGAQPAGDPDQELPFVHAEGGGRVQHGIREKRIEV